VQDFDWLEFLAAYRGKEYLNWLRQKLHSIADVILIDSRTGVTEMGGVCTRQMADAVVSFCAPNFQNLEGVARVTGSLDSEAARNARDNRDLQVMVIPTRIDDSEADRLNEFSKTFGSKLEVPSLIPEALRGLDRPMWNLQVPYIPKFNYREERVIGPEVGPPDPPTKRLIQAYRNIALHLAVLAEDGGPVRRAFASEIATALPHLQPSRPPRMWPPLASNWVERPAELERLKGALKECSTAPNGGRLAVWGLAGMGKTNLVSRACQDEDIQRAFADGIVWLTLDRAWSPDMVQDWLRSAFALARTGGEQALTRALENKRFLFVVDDVWTLDQLESVFAYGRQDTRVIVTRDLATASAFQGTVVTIGAFSEGESANLLRNLSHIPSGQTDTVLSSMIAWPLGASLLRSELERRLAQKETSEQVWQTIEASLQRKGITAFDKAGVPDKSSSVARSLRGTLGRLSGEERTLLVSIGRSGDRGSVVVPADEHDSKPPEGRAPLSTAQETVGESQRLKRLESLGLVEVKASVARLHPLVWAWLVTQGELTTSVHTEKQLQREQNLRRGHEVLRGATATFDELKALAQFAKDARSFSLARRLYILARQPYQVSHLTADKKLGLAQKQALCTYKDEDLPAEERFNGAFQILAEADLQSPTPSQETLGLAGAICKCRWKITGRRSDLEGSLGYYQQGAKGPLGGDFGYTRINAAFVLDLLAKIEEKNSRSAAEALRRDAAKLRDEIVEQLPGLASQTANAWVKDEWWYGATLAEACFGLNRHWEAQFWLREALALDPPQWELETTTRQLAALAQAQGADERENSPAWQTLRILVGEADPALRALMAGKLGLALSGGGFRASFFHIGVLARLAELDVLRHVEVLSCVSGGSILGAHYYLEVRKLLQRQADSEITREDYIEIVQHLERDFLAGVQQNLRMRLLGSVSANLRSVLYPAYTRTKYLGELFERHLYARVQDDRSGPRWLDGLKIYPHGGGEDFNPKLDNWRRGTKAPILLLNATTLNTGHNWQFAVNWMGEPPMGSGVQVDRNDLLRRMYYSEAPLRYQRIRLGEAVAASACVPALFDPLELNGLYPQRSVQLVDGGVHDNQGVSGLLEQECTLIVVSDASGQMNSERAPSTEAYSVPARANSILMARVRAAEFQEIQTLRSSSALGGLMFLHLKKDLDLNRVDWVDCQDPYDRFDGAGPFHQGATLTSYGMPKTVQELLANIRTDLDSFTDCEAFSLMLCGYRMADAEIAKSLPTVQLKDAPRTAWRFQQVAPAVDHSRERAADHERLQQMLATAAARGFKVLRLSPFLGASLAASAVAVVYGAAREIGQFWHLDGWGMVRLLVGYAGGVVALLGISAIVYKILHGRKSLTVLLSGVLLATFGWFVAWPHIKVFDRIYLAFGKVGKPDSGNVSSIGLGGHRQATWLGFALCLLAGLLFLGGQRLPSSRNTMVHQADQAQARLQFSASVPDWDIVLRAEPDNKHALTRLGQALLALHRPAEAVGIFLKITPRGPEVLSDLAYAYKLQGDYRNAIATYKLLITSNPKRHSGLSRPCVRVRRAAGVRERHRHLWNNAYE